MSSIVNKVKDALHSDKSHDNKAHTSHHEGQHGPHNSKIANTADPRVDSDLDGSRRVGTGAAGTTGMPGTYGTHGTHTGAGSGLTGTHGTTGTGAGLTGTHGTHGAAGTAPGPAPSTAGPHKSDMLNKADPRVDSDMDGGKNMGATSMGGPQTTYGTGAGVGNTGFGSRTQGSGLTGTHGTHGTHDTGMAGTHGTGMTGAGSGLHSSKVTTGYDDPEGVHGPHGSRAANTADPRVDSDRDHRGAGMGYAPGPASNTAGPHKSDMMNKMDPRVDSDVDGSKTMGQSKTYGA